MIKICVNIYDLEGADALLAHVQQRAQQPRVLVVLGAVRFLVVLRAV